MPFILGTHLQLSANRDVTYGVTPTASQEPLRNTYVNSVYRSEIAFELPLRLHARTWVSYTEAQFLQPLDPGPALERGAISLERRRDHAWIVGGALLRHLGSHLSLGGTIQYGQRISQAFGHSYNGTIVGLAGELR
jgi:hypothetical protein